MGHGIDLPFAQIHRPCGLFFADGKIQHLGGKLHVLLSQTQYGKMLTGRVDGGKQNIILGGQPFAQKLLPVIIHRDGRAITALVGDQCKGTGAVHGGGENGAGKVGVQIFRIAVCHRDTGAATVIDQHIGLRHAQRGMVVSQLDGIAAVAQTADKGIGVARGHRQTGRKGGINRIQTGLEAVFGKGVGHGAGGLQIRSQPLEVFRAQVVLITENSKDHTGQHSQQRQRMKRAGNRQPFVLAEAGDIVF